MIRKIIKEALYDYLGKLLLIYPTERRDPDLDRKINIIDDILNQWDMIRIYPLEDFVLTEEEEDEDPFNV